MDEPATSRRRITFHTDMNINTILNVVTLVGMVAGGGYVWAQTTGDIDELKRWRVAVESRMANSDGKIEERFKSAEADLRKLDNLAYRVTVAEQSANSTSAAIKELQASAASQSGDLKVIREILQRIEAAQRAR